MFGPACPGTPDWLLAIQSPTQRAWTFSPNSLLTSRTQTLRPMKVSGANVCLFFFKSLFVFGVPVLQIWVQKFTFLFMRFFYSYYTN